MNSLRRGHKIHANHFGLSELDERFRNAQTLGVSRLNDDVLQRYQDVIDGAHEWTKEQVAAMRDYSQHVR